MKKTLQSIGLFIWLSAISCSAFSAYGGVMAKKTDRIIGLLPLRSIENKIEKKEGSSEVPASNSFAPAAVAPALPETSKVNPVSDMPASSDLSYPQGNDDVLNSVIFFPNPVKDVLTVRFPKKGTYTILIYNIIGDKVLEKTISDDTELKFDLSDMQNGLYFLSYEFDGKKVTKRFSKSN